MVVLLDELGDKVEFMSTLFEPTHPSLQIHNVVAMKAACDVLKRVFVMLGEATNEMHIEVPFGQDYANGIVGEVQNAHGHAGRTFLFLVPEVIGQTVKHRISVPLMRGTRCCV